MAKSKFFRVAVEGQTTDGRTIERDWIAQAAASYNPETYSARVNMEHIRGFSHEGPFKAYGDVLALKADEIELELDGKAEKRLALFAQVDATDELVSLNKQRQKLFSSCEFAPNFAGTGKAYLVGLAVTDSPASLGTEMLAFAAGQGDNSPLAGRKLDAANLFTTATELELELEADPAAGDEPVTVKGLVAFAAELVGKLTGKPAAEPTVETPPVEPTVETPAAFSADDAQALVASFGAVAAAVEKTSSETAAKLDEISGRVDQLAAIVDATPENLSRRPLATGGNGAIRTDC